MKEGADFSSDKLIFEICSPNQPSRLRGKMSFLHAGMRCRENQFRFSISDVLMSD
jgi:hypothetical protein